MNIGNSFRQGARFIINKGNSASLYSYSGATKVTNEEGDVTISDWKTATAIKIVDPNLIKESLTQVDQGLETIGGDTSAIRDDVSVSENDRITINSIDYKVVEVSPIEIEDVVVYQTITISRVTSSTIW